MSKMTVIWLLLYSGGLVMSFTNPMFGLLVYVFEYYWRPIHHWWGRPLPTLRWSFIASAVMLLTYLLRRNSLPALRPIRNPALPWILGLGAVMIVMTPFAVDVAGSMDAAELFWKYVLFYVIAIAIIRTPAAFDAFVALHMAGAAWWGWEAYREPHRAEGRLMEVGSSDSLNDNLAAAHLLTVLPFIIVVLLTAKDKRMRALALVAAPLVVNVIILCNSRGATVGMAVAAAAALLFTSWRVRIRLVGVLAVLIAGFLMLADPEFITRQQTTTQTDQGTAVSRMDSWRGGLNLIRDYPLGAGGRGYEALSPIYIAGQVDAHGGQERAPHNTFVLVASEWGIQGFALFVGLIVVTIRALHRVRKIAGTPDWFYYRSLAVELAIIATLTAGFFSDRLYGESTYWMCALAIALLRIQHTYGVKLTSPATVLAPAASRPAADLVPMRTPALSPHAIRIPSHLAGRPR